MGINKPYSTEMETFVELEKDERNPCLFMASATAVNKNGCGKVVMFGLELKTNVASSVEIVEYNRYLCCGIYSKVNLKKARTVLQRICEFALIKWNGCKVESHVEKHSRGKV